MDVVEQLLSQPPMELGIACQAVLRLVQQASKGHTRSDRPTGGVYWSDAGHHNRIDVSSRQFEASVLQAARGVFEEKLRQLASTEHRLVDVDVRTISSLRADLDRISRVLEETAPPVTITPSKDGDGGSETQGSGVTLRLTTPSVLLSSPGLGGSHGGTARRVTFADLYTSTAPSPFGTREEVTQDASMVGTPASVPRAAGGAARLSVLLDQITGLNLPPAEDEVQVVAPSQLLASHDSFLGPQGPETELAKQTRVTALLAATGCADVLALADAEVGEDEDTRAAASSTEQGFFVAVPTISVESFPPVAAVGVRPLPSSQSSNSAALAAPVFPPVMRTLTFNDDGDPAKDHVSSGQSPSALTPGSPVNPAPDTAALTVHLRTPRPGRDAEGSSHDVASADSATLHLPSPPRNLPPVEQPEARASSPAPQDQVISTLSLSAVSSLPDDDDVGFGATEAPGQSEGHAGSGPLSCPSTSSELSDTLPTAALALGSPMLLNIMAPWEKEAQMTSLPLSVARSSLDQSMVHAVSQPFQSQSFAQSHEPALGNVSIMRPASPRAQSPEPMWIGNHTFSPASAIKAECSVVFVDDGVCGVESTGAGAFAAALPSVESAQDHGAPTEALPQDADTTRASVPPSPPPLNPHALDENAPPAALNDRAVVARRLFVDSASPNRPHAITQLGPVRSPAACGPQFGDGCGSRLLQELHDLAVSTTPASAPPPTPPQVVPPTSPQTAPSVAQSPQRPIHRAAEPALPPVTSSSPSRARMLAQAVRAAAARDARIAAQLRKSVARAERASSASSSSGKTSLLRRLHASPTPGDLGSLPSIGRSIAASSPGDLSPARSRRGTSPSKLAAEAATEIAAAAALAGRVDAAVSSSPGIAYRLRRTPLLSPLKQ